MKSKRLIFAGVACAAVAVVMSISVARSRAAVMEVAQAGRSSVRAVPKFEVDPAWPRIPNGWALGQVASAAADEQDHVWVLHRSRNIRRDQKTGPPVMEFDAAGNYVQGWGGVGLGHPWPSSEHGIYVDYKGFVWIGGQGDDDQILKFTKAGKFVMQIGRNGQKKTNQSTTNFWKPADVFVYPRTNELFVADGYGNKRIIVFDADTGAFKRMWGAFGNVPADDPPPPPAATEQGGQGGRGGRGGRGADESSRIPAKEIDPKDPGPSQFSTIHGVKVSNDGHVYAADRAGKRVQVFTLEGKFVAQAYVDRWCEEPHCGNGETVASVAFSADPDQRFLYVASRSPARVWVYDRKTLQPLHSFGRPGVAPGEFYVLHHMTSDSKGNLYTSEVQDGRRVQKFVFKGITSPPTE
jgi:DNA-binding beta-propeller fold protein YncE